MSEKILITGGNGMLAKAIARALRLRGIQPITLDRLALDITNSQNSRIALHVYKPTVVINCAAYTKVDQAEVDVEQATLINDAQTFTANCRELVRKFIHFSTDFVFDGTSTRPYKPTDATNPLSVYGASKLGGEAMVREHCEDYLIIRTAWLYGPGGPNFVRTMLNAGRTGKSLSVVADQTGSPTFTHDLAEATMNLLDADARGIFHVSSAGSTNWFDFTQAIMEEFGVLPAALTKTTTDEWKALRPQSAVRPRYSVLDCSAYEQATGKKLPNWRDGLQRYHAYIEAHGDR